MEISTNVIVKRAVKNTNIPEHPALKKWFSDFKELSEVDQTRIMTELNKAQSVYVKDKMGEMKNPIPLYYLGKFYYKESRKEFYEIRDANPNMPLSDVINKVKEEYYKRYIKKKDNKKSKDIKVKL